MHGQEDGLVAGGKRAVGDAVVFVTDDEGDAVPVVGLVIGQGGGGDLDGCHPVALLPKAFDHPNCIFGVFPRHTPFATTPHLFYQRVRWAGGDTREQHTACTTGVGNAEGGADVDWILHVLQDEDQVQVGAPDALEKISERLAAQLARGCRIARCCHSGKEIADDDAGIGIKRGDLIASRQDGNFGVALFRGLPVDLETQLDQVDDPYSGTRLRA